MSLNGQQFPVFLKKFLTKINTYFKMFLKSNKKISHIIRHLTPDRESLLNGKHILIVDDEPYTVVALQVLLEEAGARVTLVQTLQRALDELQVRTPDLVLVDLRMTNGLPQELSRYADDPKDYQRYGQALTRWLDKNRQSVRWYYYTILPALIDQREKERSFDKLSLTPREVFGKINTIFPDNEETQL